MAKNAKKIFFLQKIKIKGCFTVYKELCNVNIRLHYQRTFVLSKTIDYASEMK